jgi:hypothetical protein
MAVGQIYSFTAVEFSILICLISDFSVQGDKIHTPRIHPNIDAWITSSFSPVDSARIIDYGASQNDTRINWDDALPLGSPYEPSLYFWCVMNFLWHGTTLF